MEWKLPTNVGKVECLYTWLVKILSEHKDHQEVVKFVSQQKLQVENNDESIRRGTNRDDCINSTAVDKNKYDDDFDPGDENIKHLHPQNSNYVVVLSIELVRSCKAAFLGNYEESRKHLRKVQGAFSFLTGDHDRLLRVFQYCVETTEWCIVNLEQQDVNEDVNKDDAQVAAFGKEWEEFQRDKRDRPVIIYLKSRLENNVLGNDRNKKVEVLTEILDLDPDYYIWWTISYQEMRRSRRPYKQQDKMKAPCMNEIDYCNKAYDLAPDTLLCTYNKATMLKDIIFAKQDAPNFLFSYPRSPLYEMSVSELRAKCLESLDKAVYLTGQLGLQHRTMQIFLQKVDILTKDEENDANRKEGLRLLEDAIQDDSNNAHIYLKLGKIYQYGLGPERDFKDVNKARFYFEQALDKGISLYTFACIKSYLKLLPHLPNPLPVEETLQLLGLHYSSLKTDFQRGTVTMWKGFLQWVLSSTQISGRPCKRMACTEWLDALGFYPEKQEKLLESLQNILSDFSRSVGKQQFINELKVELTTIRGEAAGGLQPSGYVALVHRFLGELQIWQESIVPPRHQIRRRGGGRGENYRQQKHVQRGNGRCQIFQPGLGDQSDNWRLN